MNKIYSENRSFLGKFIAVLIASLFTGSMLFAQYVNGNLSTGATATGGTAAPAGYTWSELQPGSGTFGFAASITATNDRIADDFTVPAGQTWNITSMVFYGYLTNYASTTVSPFTAVHVQIHSGSVTGPVVFGDLTTNRLASTANANMYRIANATPGTARLIWSITANVTAALPSGTYWIEYATDVTGGAAHFLPPSTVVGTTTQPGNNAQQFDAVGTNAWAALLDGTNPQDMPFRINYTASGAACTGTPAPGATVSTANPVCPGTPFTLSVANATTGLGVTYQWQSSATGAPGSYTNIAGATSSTYNIATQAASTYYQLVVTCSGNNGTSTPLQVVTNPPSACYCTPAASNCGLDDEIQNVTFAGINNNSTCIGASGYASYLSGTPASVVVGGSYPMSVTIGPGGGDVIGVWIDYDHSGSFDAGEFTVVGTTTGGTVSNTIVIPSTALTGATRMRVRSHFSGAMAGTEACTTYVYGETEDYTVNINPCVAVQITTSPTDQSVLCGGNATFTVGVNATGSVPAYQWEYRTSATGVWLVVPNTPPYSGVNTATLTVTGATTALNGYQYRAMVSGACAGPTPSGAATLTVTQITAVVTPASATICTGGIQQLTLANTLGNTTVLTEGFDAGIPATWPTQNRSVPIGPSNWAQGDPATYGVTSHSGAANSYVASAYDAASVGVNNTISNWLFTPVLSIKNGDVFTFWSRIPTLAQSGGVEYPDRLEVRQSSNNTSTNVGATATSVGDFSNLLLTINPTLVTGVYPQVWTQYTVTVTGVTGTVNGRMAFRSFNTDNGSGANEDYIAIDDVTYVSSGAAAAGVWTGPAGTIFTNAAATTAYNGTTPLNTVYVAPTAVGVNNYSVSFLSSAGACTSTTATVPVTVNTAPAGTPAVANITVCANTNAVFSVTGITGGTGLTYQWQVSSNNGVSYSNIAGATSATYTVSGTAAINGNKYRVVVSSTGCAASLTSTAGQLTVNPTPVVTISAAPVVNIMPGVTSTLTAAVSSATAPLSYQWYLNGAAVSGATTNMYVVGVDYEGQYTVKVTDANGCTAAAGTSTPASITIGDAPGTILFIYPSPNSGRFQVRYYNDLNNGGTAPAFVNVYDSKGARVFTRKYTLSAGYNAMNVDLGNHGRGLYRVELVDLNGNRIKTGSAMVF